MKRTSQLAFCSIAIAISVVLLNLALFIPFASYSLCFICSAFIYLIAIEVNNKYAFMVYFVVSTFSFFSVIYSDSALLYVLIFGYYPIIKNFFDNIKIKFLKFFLMFIFNFIISCVIVNVVIYIFLAIGFLKTKQISNLYIVCIIIFFNFVIVLYSVCLSMFKTYYFNIFKIRNKFY